MDRVAPRLARSARRGYLRGILTRALRFAAILALLGLLTAFVVTTRRLAREPLAASAPAATPAAASRPFAFQSNEDCRRCHEAIWEEWSGDQHALAWFNQPFLDPDPKRTECNNCHAPEPILEVGIESLPIIRTARFEEGVGCIECHRKVDHVEGPLPGRDAACNPTANATFTESRICASCHAPHGSLDEWRASEWSRKGYTCQSCHMPLVERPSATGGPVRKVRTHRMRSQRDPDMLRGAVMLEARVEGREAVVALTNAGAAHNVPGEIFNREMFVTTTITADGQEPVVHRESLKTVKREQRATETSTQLKSGETRTWRYELPAGHGTIAVVVRYKLLFVIPDHAADTVHEKTLAF